MKKRLILCPGLLLFVLAMSGCSAIGNKSASFSIIYAAMAILSLVLLVAYSYLIHKKDPWFLLLFAAVFIVNAGYFSLSISSTLAEALLANRISYLGSVFLPMSILLVILNVTHLHVPKWFPGLLLLLGVLVFFVAASPGFLDIYYKEVTMEKINGATVLHKVYGPWHNLYLYYLLGYLASFIIAITCAIEKKKLESKVLTLVLTVAAFINMGVWLIEQLVKMDFEFLSISYIITELFLLCLYLMVQEGAKFSRIPSAPEENPSAQRIPPVTIPDVTTVTTEPAPPLPPETIPTAPNPDFELIRSMFLTGLAELTYTEQRIYNLYLQGRTTAQILDVLSIKENTLKYHNKNIYSKLGVSSRKQLTALARTIHPEDVSQNI